jgi:hypothetical protein
MSAEPERTPLRSVETPLGRFDLLEGGVLFWTVSTGTVLDRTTAQEAYDTVNALAPGDPIAIIGDARGLGFADRGARELLANSSIEGRVATGVIASNRMIRFLANRYAKQVGDRAFGVFDSEPEAIAWAAEQVQIASGG